MIHLKMKKYSQIVAENADSQKHVTLLQSEAEEKLFTLSRHISRLNTKRAPWKSWYSKYSRLIHLHYLGLVGIVPYFGFSRVTFGCIIQRRQEALYEHICLYCSYPLAYCCVSFESVACNCWSCSCCCLWLINELVDQRENPLSLWKTRPICLFYPPRAVLPLLISTMQ